MKVRILGAVTGPAELERDGLHAIQSVSIHIPSGCWPAGIWTEFDRFREMDDCFWTEVDFR